MTRRRTITLLLLLASSACSAALAACGDDEQGASSDQPEHGDASAGTPDGSQSTDATGGDSQTEGGPHSDYDGGYPLVDYSNQDAGFPITRLLRPKTPCGVPGFPRPGENGVVQLLDLTNPEGTKISDPPIARSGNRAVTTSVTGVRLWDVATLEQIANFENEYVREGKSQYFLTSETNEDALAVRAFSDGHRVGRIAGSFSGAQVGLAEDESYVYAVHPNGAVDTYSPAGGPIFHRDATAGDYPNVDVVAAAGELRIGAPYHFAASSPPTPWTETILLPSGTSTRRTFATDSGVPRFRRWFAGGEYFILDISSTKAEVYTKNGVYVATLPGGNSNLNVGGAGFYYWRRRENAGVEVYDVRNPSKVPDFFEGPDEIQQIVHDYAIYVGGKVVVFDPAGLRTEPAAIPTLDEVHGIRADKSGNFILGDGIGGIFVGTVPGHVGEIGVLGCGRPAWAAGAGESSPRVAVATEGSGEIYVFDIGAGTAGLAARIPMISQDFAFAANGTRLVVAPDKKRYVPQRALSTFSVPGGALASSGPAVTELTLFRTSLAGSTLARVEGIGTRTVVVSNLDGTSESFRETSALGGGATVSNVPDPPPALPSPGGSRVAVNDTVAYSVPSKGRIVTSGTVSATIQGYVYGWLDENRLLASRFSWPDSGGGFVPNIQWVILDTSGAVVGTPNLALDSIAEHYARREPLLLDANTLLARGDAWNLTTGASQDDTGLREAFGISGTQRVAIDDTYLVSGKRRP
jgi:hypothetical protein